MNLRGEDYPPVLVGLWRMLRSAKRQGQAQDVTFFYSGSYLSELQNCTLILPASFVLFSYLCSTRHTLVILLCRALKIMF